VTGLTRGRSRTCPGFPFVLLLILSCFGCKPPEESNVKAIVGAVLIDGTGGPPVSNSIVLVSGPRIAGTGPRTAFVIPQGTEEIDGARQYIIPALIDVYVRSGDGVAATAGGQTFPAGVLTAQLSPEQCRDQVDEFATERRYMVLVDGLTPQAEEAALDEGRKMKIPVFARVSRLADAQRLVAAGATGFIGMIVDSEQIDRAFINKMRDLRVIWTPALVDQPGATLEAAKRNTMRLAAGGVLIAAGGTPIERELEMLVDAGLSPGDAIVAATRNGAMVLRRTLDLGTLQTGKRADLLMLPKNPIEDIRNLQQRGREMLGGAWVK
jgi:imidazolonepropionase-like amidohydrolase